LVKHIGGRYVYKLPRGSLRQRLKGAQGKRDCSTGQAAELARGGKEKQTVGKARSIKIKPHPRGGRERKK